MMTAQLRRLRLKSFCTALVLAACSGTPGTTPPAQNPHLAAGLVITMQLAATDQTAYVALVPGTIDSGTTATIVNVASGARRTTAVVDGGFDPVGVPANFGDTLSISVATSTGAVVVAEVVAAARPPHVIRVSPAKSQIDVPVNTNLTVVFSEPVNAGTLTSATMQLRQGTTTVPGTIAIDPASPWLATFTPTQPLVPAAAYTFTVTGAITDPSGLTLDAPITSTFVTADPQPVAAVVVTPRSIEFAGQTQLTAIAKDAAGNALPGGRFVWTSSNPQIASVDSTGLVTAVPQEMGTVTITATVGGRGGIAVLKADCANLALQCLAGSFARGVRTISGTISQLMPDGTRQPVPNATYYEWFYVLNFPVPSSYMYSRGPLQTDANGRFSMDSVQDGVAVVDLVVGFDQPCTTVANTIGHDAVMNVTVVDQAHPLPQFATAPPALSGTVTQMVNGTLVPVIGALVQVTTAEDVVVAVTHADSAGHYSICNLPFSELYFGENLSLSATKPFYGAFTPLLPLKAGGTRDIIVP